MTNRSHQHDASSAMAHEVVDDVTALYRAVLQDDEDAEEIIMAATPCMRCLARACVQYGAGFALDAGFSRAGLDAAIAALQREHT